MRRLLSSLLVIACIAFVFSLCGCSDDQNAGKTPAKKGVIKEMTDQTAHEITNQIQKPIHRAQDVKNMVEKQQAKTFEEK